MCLGGFDVGEEGRWVRRPRGSSVSGGGGGGGGGGEEGGDKTKRHGGSETLHKHLAA